MAGGSAACNWCTPTSAGAGPGTTRTRACAAGSPCWAPGSRRTAAGGWGERRLSPGIPAGGGERGQPVADLAGDAVEGRLVVLGGGDDGLVHPGRERGHVLLTQAAGSDRGRADAQAGGVERLALVERHRVVVRLDARPVQRLGGRLAADALGGEIHQDQVIVR